ncbi:hypothetical protein LX73_2335 [Fodinibius salinus]|uniref:Uncharacterized protein n=1 Tax=Fodinibius salinus TaxID=860790 RepID=A0A5D3YG40_9BACT|nr:hypothetical protein [Fodinibius salinus]TYP92088.1 hypothetical protein LX73_2335 [Fodinibius salinus]
MKNSKEQLIKKASYYTPAKSVELDASGGANDEQTIKFTGLDNELYGVNRFLAGGTGLNEVVATASFNNGRDDKFEEIHLNCLNQLFMNRSLRGALPIQRGDEMFLTLKNTGANPHIVNTEIIGFDDFQLQQKRQKYESNGGQFPKPEFVYLKNTTIPAGTTKSKFSISLPSYKLRLYRMAFATDDPGQNLTVAIRQARKKIKPEVYISQLNNEFKNMDIILPQTLAASTPFDLFVSNADGANSYQLSMLAECYKI